MAKYLSRINDATGSAQGAKGNVNERNFKTQTFIIDQRKSLRNFIMMMADGDVIQYEKLYTFAMSDFLTKADQFSRQMESKIRAAKKR